MADEISMMVSIRCTNGTFVMTPTTISKTIDQSSAGGDGPGVVTVATSETTVDFGDLTPGPMLLQNLDTTNYVNYGTSTGNLGFRLTPGNEPALVYLESGEDLIMQANTATCKVLVKAANA